MKHDLFRINLDKTLLNHKLNLTVTQLNLNVGYDKKYHNVTFQSGV